MVDVLYPIGWFADAATHVGKIQIRSDSPVRERLEDALALAVPETPNRETRREGLACAALAPGEWLVTGAGDEVERALARVREIFSEDLCLAIDLTAGRFVLTFSGPDAVAFLTSYTPLDVDPERFPTAAAARTQLGDIGLYVTRLDDQPTYRLIIDQSFAGYFCHLLSLDRASD